MTTAATAAFRKAHATARGKRLSIEAFRNLRRRRPTGAALDWTEVTTAVRPEIGRLADHIGAAGSVVALTGAGISVPSGIPDFRTPVTGLWANVDPMEVAHIDAWREDPARFWGFYGERFATLTASSPTARTARWSSSSAAATSTRSSPRTSTCCTARPGPGGWWRCTGLSSSPGCLEDGQEVPLAETRRRLATAADGVPRCDCGEPLKPGVVLFGEMLPEAAIDEAYRAGAGGRSAALHRDLARGAPGRAAARCDGRPRGCGGACDPGCDVVGRTGGGEARRRRGGRTAGARRRAGLIARDAGRAWVRTAPPAARGTWVDWVPPVGGCRPTSGVAACGGGAAPRTPVRCAPATRPPGAPRRARPPRPRHRSRRRRARTPRPPRPPAAARGARGPAGPGRRSRPTARARRRRCAARPRPGGWPRAGGRR